MRASPALCSYNAAVASSFQAYVVVAVLCCLPVLCLRSIARESLLVSLGLLCSPLVSLNRRKSCPDAPRSLEE
jgi:hypothetical protein